MRRHPAKSDIYDVNVIVVKRTARAEPATLNGLTAYATAHCRGSYREWRNSEWAKVSKALGIELRKAIKQQGEEA